MNLIPITVWGKLDPADHYLCSIDGDVLSTKFGKTKPIKLCPNSTSYLCFSYYKDGIRTRMLVHRFVAMIFLGDRTSEGLIVTHGRKGKLDNSLENLSWGTYSDNMGLDRERDGTMPRGERSGSSKLTEDYVMQIPKLRALGLSQQEIGDLFGVSRSQISLLLSGKTWRHLFSYSALVIK